MMICVICALQLDKTKPIVSLRCGHMYHIDCINRWRRRSQKCPHCRHNFSLSQAVKIHPIISNSFWVKLKSDLTCLNNSIIQKEREIDSFRSQMQILKVENANNRISRENVIKLENDKKRLENKLVQKTAKLKSTRAQIQISNDNSVSTRDRLIKLENDLKCSKDELKLKNDELLQSKSQIQDLQMEYDMNLGYFLNKFENDLKSARQELKLKGIALKTSQRQIALGRKRQLKFAKDWKKSYLLSKIILADYGKLEEYIINSKFQDPRAKRSFIQCFQKWEKFMKIYPNFPNLKVSPK